MSWSYRPALDGLRSVAVYLVVLFHAGVALVAGGFIGVDLFFVLSGFLVSNVILSELRQTGRLDLGRFYARRVRRLLPAAVVVVTATAAMFLVLFPAVRRLPLVTDAQSALLYAANWNFLLKSNDYFAADVVKSPFLHFWSLAIEEQFYALFPILLLVLFRLQRRRPSAMLTVLSALLLLSLASQLYWARTNLSWAYYGTDARLYQLLAGAVLAVLLRVSRRPSPRFMGGVALAGLALLLVLGSGLPTMSPSTRGIGATVASVALVAGLMSSETGLLTRLLSRRTPVYLGKVSYGTYLWHWPVILVVEQLLAAPPLVVAVLAVAVSTAFAALSFELLELPMRTSGSLRRFRWSTVVVGVATSAVVAATVVPSVLESQRRPQQLLAAAQEPAVATLAAGAGQGATPRERNAQVPRDIDWRAMTGSPKDEPLCTVEQPAACTLVRGSGPHIVLVGDSHAKMLTPMFTMLAKEHGLTFSHNAVPACPWQADVVLRRLPEPRLEECLAQRDQWYDQVLPQLDADLVVLVAIHRGEDEEAGRGELVQTGRPLTRVGGSDESVSELMFATTQETVAKIESKGPRVLIIESLPIPGRGDPLECLGRADRVRECEVPLPQQPAPSDSFARVAAELSAKVFTVNLRPVFCHGAPRCLPVIDGVVVWSDMHHLSVAITRHRRAEVWEAIMATGALGDVPPPERDSEPR